jgi:NTF2 fold immunity protein
MKSLKIWTTFTLAFLIGCDCRLPVKSNEHHMSRTHNSKTKTESQCHLDLDGLPSSEYAIPDSITAAAIAEVYIMRRYGKSSADDKPYNVMLRDSTVWIVSGTLPPGTRGGCAILQLDAKRGTLLSVYHGE